MCFSDYDPPEFCDIQTRKARTAKRCCECRQTIEAGALYEHVAGKWCGEFAAFATCPACVATRHNVHARETAEGCRDSESWPPFGGLNEMLVDYGPPIQRGTAEQGIAILQRQKGGEA